MLTTSRHRSRKGTVKVLLVLVSALLVYAIFAFFLPRFFVPGSVGIFQISQKTTKTFSVFTASFRDQIALVRERDALKNEVAILETRLLAQSHILSENTELKRLMGREEVVDMLTERETPLISSRRVLSRVLARPPRTPYDTLVLDQGSARNISLGAPVIGPGGFAIGTIEEVSGSSSLARLLSAPGRESDGLVGDARTPITLTGEGGGAFITHVPKDTLIQEGDVVRSLLLGGMPYAEVRAIVLKEREPTMTVYLSLSLNFFETEWVYILLP